MYSIVCVFINPSKMLILVQSDLENKEILIDMKTKVKMPVPLLVLDFIGTIFIGLGLAEKFAGTGLVPRTIQFPNYEWVLIIIGIIFTVPFIAHLVKSIVKANDL